MAEKEVTKDEVVGKRGRVASNQPSLLKFQAALRADGACPEWISVTPGSINAETRILTPTLYESPVTLRLTNDGQSVEAVQFTAQEHRAATVKVIASVDAGKFVKWATSPKK
jgi:hypothetical protein